MSFSQFHVLSLHSSSDPLHYLSASMSVRTLVLQFTCIGTILNVIFKNILFFRCLWGKGKGLHWEKGSTKWCWYFSEMSHLVGIINLRPPRKIWLGLHTRECHHKVTVDTYSLLDQHGRLAAKAISQGDSLA